MSCVSACRSRPCRHSPRRASGHPAYGKSNLQRFRVFVSPFHFPFAIQPFTVLVSDPTCFAISLGGTPVACNRLASFCRIRYALNRQGSEQKRASPRRSPEISYHFLH